jgi:hypothetical protein
MRERFEPEGILFVAERVGVRQRFSGAVPGRRDALGVSRHKGLVIATRSRLYAAIPTLARLPETPVDRPWSTETHGPATVTVDESGVHMHIALKRVDPRFSGDLDTTWKCPIAADVLASLPSRRLSFDVSPAYVFCSLGVRVRP